MLHIRLFGGLTVLWDGEPLPPISRTLARSLLAYLVTYRDRPHTRDLLAGTFWPDLTDVAARRRLSQALWEIRRALTPHEVLLTEGDTIQFNPRLPLWLDVTAFEKLVGPQSGAGNQTASSSQVQALRDAVELYCGDFMAGYYDDWVLVERERLRGRFLVALEMLISKLKMRGDYESALLYARRLVAADPLREQVHREVMQLCHLLGRDNEARQQYELCREMLARELGTEPAASTKALLQEITAAGTVEPPHLPVAPRPPSTPLLERPDLVPLVGRKSERAELARMLSRTVRGSGGMALVIGGAGIGKTRLMHEVARDAEWRSVRVMWGHSCELSTPPPYQPLVEVLSDADLSRLLPMWQRELGRLIPGEAPPPARDAEHNKGLLLEALARAFLALGEVEPHMVILEDIHWMDSASFEALRVLLPRLTRSRLLIVCTLRPEELVEQPLVRQALASLEATRIPRRLELAPLTESETMDLVQRLLAAERPAPLFSRRLHIETEGNPFFITETLRAWVEQGVLSRSEEGGWSTAWDNVTDDYSALPVPVSVVQSIQQRLARLTSPERDLLGIAAVIGQQVEFDLWRRSCQWEEEAMLRVAEELCRRGLIVEAREFLGYRFAHAKIRQVAYQALSPVRRRYWHRRVGEALQALQPEQVEALAWHFRLGEDWPRAVQFITRAGDRAWAVYANRHALDHYRQADAWLAAGRVDWPAEQVARWRAELAEKQGQVYSLIGEYEAAEASFSRARETWNRLGEKLSEAHVLNRLSFMFFVQDEYEQASHFARQAMAVLPQRDQPADLRAISLTHLGLSAWSQGKYEDALPPLEEALTLFEQVGTDQWGLARCLNSLGLVHLELGALDLADAHFARSLAIRQEIGDRRGEAWCWHNQGRTSFARGDLVAAREKLGVAQAIFAEIEHPNGIEAAARLLAQVETAQAASGGIQQRTVHLPSATAPTGRPLRDDEFVTVTWTIAAPEDNAGSDAALRRQRLLRLVREAVEQSAAPTVAALAQALGVSERTIKRDLAALRAAGHDVPTRGARA